MIRNVIVLRPETLRHSQLSTVTVKRKGVMFGQGIIPVLHNILRFSFLFYIVNILKVIRNDIVLLQEVLQVTLSERNYYFRSVRILARFCPKVTLFGQFRRQYELGGPSIDSWSLSMDELKLRASEKIGAIHVSNSLVRLCFPATKCSRLIFLMQIQTQEGQLSYILVYLFVFSFK